MNRAIGTTYATKLLRLIMPGKTDSYLVRKLNFLVMISDGNGKPESRQSDPEQVIKLLEIELAQKRTEWSQASERYRKMRTASFVFLALVILGALVGFLYFQPAAGATSGQNGIALLRDTLRLRRYWTLVRQSGGPLPWCANPACHFPGAPIRRTLPRISPNLGAPSPVRQSPACRSPVRQSHGVPAPGSPIRRVPA